MPSAAHRRYLAQAAEHGHTPEQAEQTLRQVRQQAGDGYVTDLYERALLMLDTGVPTGRQRSDADHILAQHGMAGAPAEVRDTIAGMLGRMGLTVGPDGGPAPAGINERFSDTADGLEGIQGLLRPAPAARSGRAPSGHFTTFVLPAEDRRAERTIPFLVLAAEEPDDVEQLALPTSLHRIGNEVMAYARARALSESPGPMPVSDAWILAVSDYEAEAKVVVILEPVAAAAPTDEAVPTTGVGGADLPWWTGRLLNGQLRAAARDVPVSAGADPMSINIVPSASQELSAWAERIITPGEHSE
ncbi:hypothetical protein [Nocardiopsis synnemataformans]|uniref:hypothetical protein n=1 Tax=Nocardiopsis synnemataformans TaxID=61305 RepID=UPI003EB7F3CC